jgi:hypothetical protein
MIQWNAVESKLLKTLKSPVFMRVLKGSRVWSPTNWTTSHPWGSLQNALEATPGRNKKKSQQVPEDRDSRDSTYLI